MKRSVVNAREELERILGDIEGLGEAMGVGAWGVICRLVVILNGKEPRRHEEGQKDA